MNRESILDVENFIDARCLQFHVGSAATELPYESEAYYDVHISTHSFHWVPDDEKKIYLGKAYRSLKTGGKLAILCGEKPVCVKVSIFGPHMLTYDEYLKLFQEVGLFSDVVIKKELYVARFKAIDEFKRWYEATIRQRFDALNLKDVQLNVFTNNDGSVTCDIPRNRITARKK